MRPIPADTACVLVNLSGDFQVIERVISGGQFGADLGGLIAAKACGIPTGGTAPKGFRTERGNYRILGSAFGLVEHSSPDYPARTEQNVINSDITVYFIGKGGDNSSGFYCTQKFANIHYKPFWSIRENFWGSESPDQLAMKLYLKDYRILNVAGSRESKSRGIEEWVTKFLVTTFKIMKIHCELQGSDVEEMREEPAY
jgi:hypothetical protein